MFSTFVGLGRFINCQRPDIDTYCVYHTKHLQNKICNGSSFLIADSISWGITRTLRFNRKFDTPKSPRALRALFF